MVFDFCNYFEKTMPFIGLNCYQNALTVISKEI